MICVSVDNGLSGSACIMSGDVIISMCVMPVKASKKGREVDVVALWHWIDMHVGHQLDQVRCVIEEPGGAKSYKAAVSMAASFHALRSMFELKGLSPHRCTPQSWQKNLLNAKKGDTKPAALRKARELWPAENWLATKRSSVPHDGLVDAALINHWFRNFAV